MKSKLIVKNFGPIKNASLDLRSVNVLIGKQASGKSTLAKIYTICKSPEMYHLISEPVSNKLINEDLNNYNLIKELRLDIFFNSLDNFAIGDFISAKTEINFESPTHNFTFKNNKITYEDKIDFLKYRKLISNSDVKQFKKEIKILRNLSDVFDFEYKFDLFFERIYIKLSDEERDNFKFQDEFSKFRKKFEENDEISIQELSIILKTINSFEYNIFINSAIYIPAERTILNLIKQSSFAFQKGKVSIPNHILEFGTIYQNATNNIKKYDLGFLKKDTFYKNNNGEDRIYFSTRKSIKLTESASGIQSVLPILLPIEYEKSKGIEREHFSFVIEEPETNLFPSAQYGLLKFLEKSRSDDFGKIDKGIIHTYTTHSPFILTSMNNLLYAYKIGSNRSNEVRKKINNIIEEDCWLNPDNFSAYQLVDGRAKSIFSRKDGLISDNVIDTVSDEILGDFRQIAIISAEVDERNI